MLRWEEDLQLPPEEVDKKLWSGAASAGWRVTPRYAHAAEKSTWAYLAPSGVRLMSKAAAYAAAVDGGQAALKAKQEVAGTVATKLADSPAAHAAIAQAQAENLTLVRSINSQTGYKHVMYRPQSKVPFAVWVNRHCSEGKGSTKLGTFGTAEEGAYCYARHLGPEQSAMEAAAEMSKLEARERVSSSGVPSESLDPSRAPGGKGVPKKCTKCGQLKKGHKCPLAPSPSGVEEDDEADGESTPKRKKAGRKKKTPAVDDDFIATPASAPAVAIANVTAVEQQPAVAVEHAVAIEHTVAVANALPERQQHVVALASQPFYSLPGNPVVAVPMGIW